MPRRAGIRNQEESTMGLQQGSGPRVRGSLLDGKVAIITGAGGGIGRAEALLFAKEGARIVVNDLGGARDGTGSSEAAAAKVVEEIKGAGGEAVPSYDSVTTLEGAGRIIKAAVDAFGRVDILVNNAGILRDKTLLKTDEAIWDAVIDVHLKGTFLCTQAAARQMVAQGGGGRIINTTSVSGMMGNFGQSNYSAAKAGIYGFTRTAAIELQKHRITVNALAPIAKTRLTEDLPLFQSAGATLTPEHVAPAALFLASDLCADRTGHVLAVAGAQVFIFKVVQSPGKFKDEGGVWTAEEIAEHWDAITKL
jgi:NAD(P)-dependent dehydrogenase (short-subunit alcohol dehydrogenase family)